jgi:hypothetical protein
LDDFGVSAWTSEEERSFELDFFFFDVFLDDFGVSVCTLEDESSVSAL